MNSNIWKEKENYIRYKSEMKWKANETEDENKKCKTCSVKNKFKPLIFWRTCLGLLIKIKS